MTNMEEMIADVSKETADLTIAIGRLCRGHNGLTVLTACLMIATDVVGKLVDAPDADKLQIINMFASTMIEDRAEGYTVQ